MSVDLRARGPLDGGVAASRDASQTADLIIADEGVGKGLMGESADIMTDRALVILARSRTADQNEFQSGVSTIAASPLLPSAFRLAVAVSCGEQRILSARERADRRRHSARILVVEDHPTNQDVLQRQLALLGYASDIADNGHAGLDAWRSGRYDAVITDCSMPLMDGYQMTGLIRAEEAGAGRPVPVIGLTASAAPDETRRCRESGMSDCLIKPADLAQIDDCLSRWLATGDPESAAVPTTGPVPAQAADTDTASCIEQLEQLYGDRERIEWLLNEFFQTAEKDVADAQVAFANGDGASLRRISHSLAGAAGVVCARRVAHLGREISQAPAETPKVRIGTLIDDLAGAVTDYRRSIHAWLGAAGPPGAGGARPILEPEA